MAVSSPLYGNLNILKNKRDTNVIFVCDPLFDFCLHYSDNIT